MLIGKEDVKKYVPLMKEKTVDAERLVEPVFVGRKRDIKEIVNASYAEKSGRRKW